MRFAQVLLLIAAALGLSACASKFKTYNGPEVTQVLVEKGAREMYLLHGNVALKSYRISLGSNPVGAKKVEGDGRTPEGLYRIDRRNPNSEYHLSLGISYPDAHDAKVAKEAGESPGGDIFIHGRGRGPRTTADWTAGCIAVSNREIEDIYAMVRDGTPILIVP